MIAPSRAARSLKATRYGVMERPMIEDHAAMRMIAKDPKLAGHMLEMHADIMRAVHDVMTKYGQEMASGE